MVARPASHDTTTVPGYSIWERDVNVNRWRWARLNWPDDGVGCQHHGGRATRDEAIAAARRDHEFGRSGAGNTAEK